MESDHVGKSKKSKNTTRNNEHLNEEYSIDHDYHKINEIIDLVIKHTNSCNIKELGKSDIILNDEYFLNQTIMEKLKTEAIKLKALGITEMISTNKLICILNFMTINIQHGNGFVLTINENQNTRRSLTESVIRAADACFISLILMTIPNVPKRLHLENVIDTIILFINYQLHNSIYITFNHTFGSNNKIKETTKPCQISNIIMLLYKEIIEIINLLTELLNSNVITNTLLRYVVSISVSPFFVENVSELQHSCLKLITTIFSQYEKYRKLILVEVFSFIINLPNDKQSYFTYDIGNKEYIQVFTALILQLIQSAVTLPENSTKNEIANNYELLCKKLEKVTATAITFLTEFFTKCIQKYEDVHYKPLFENFVQDILFIVNKPEWPAAELLLSLLYKLLLKTSIDKEKSIELRVASLECSGLITTYLRRSNNMFYVVTAKIDKIIEDVKSANINDAGGSLYKENSVKVDKIEDKIRFLQQILLDFLASNSQNSETYKQAMYFYIAMWHKNQISETPRGKISKKPRSKSSLQKCNITRKPFYFNEISFRKASLGNVDYGCVKLIALYLSDKKNFSINFENYVKSVLILLRETSISIRMKALKCLITILEIDILVLERHDVQEVVNQLFFDQAISVREAVIDLVGKFILNQPELIDRYYEMLSGRILDTGVSVRKRVIKILRDICEKHPDFPKITEIYIKMIKRINDEEGVSNLIVEVFQNMWFTPTTTTVLLQRVINITNVVASLKEDDLEQFEHLLSYLMKSKDRMPQSFLLVYTQTVDCLMKNVLQLRGDEMACLTTLYIFAKINPQLVTKHASNLFTYLNLKSQSNLNLQSMNSIVQILELLVLSMKDPSKNFLIPLEENLMKLILQYNRAIVASCLSCLAAIINNHSRNFELIRSCFKRYYNYLVQIKQCLLSDNSSSVFSDIKHRQYFRRALFTISLLLRHFDFRDDEVIVELPKNITELIFELFSFFFQQNDQDIQINMLNAIRSICIRYCEFMLKDECKIFYCRILTAEDVFPVMKSEVLINIEMYLLQEENNIVKQNLNWEEKSKHINLKQIDDGSSGMAGAIIQHYIKQILQSYLHPNLLVRRPAVRVVQLILSQGLVYPLQIIPYLICMSTDCEKTISYAAKKLLLNLDKKYPGFVHAKSFLGIHLSYKLQEILHKNEVVRGITQTKPEVKPYSLNEPLYSIIRKSRKERHSLVLNILRQFEEQLHTSLSYMLYLADNLAYFPYTMQEEPLFVIYHINTMLSFSGTYLLQLFREGLNADDVQEQTNEPEVNTKVSALDEDDNIETLFARIPDDSSHLQACLTAAQGCLLLLHLKQHLKDAYDLSDSKIQLYFPYESGKVYEKGVSHKSNVFFNPARIINRLKEGIPSNNLNDKCRKDLIHQYLEFKEQMLHLDCDKP